MEFNEQPTFERELSVEALTTALNDKDWVVVDVRPTDAYNGWALDNLGAAGHLPGAVDFPADWLDVDVPDRADQLTQVLRTKGILASRKIVLCDSQPERRQRVAEFLRAQGFESLFVFDLRAWLAAGRKLKRNPQYQKLVPPQVVKQLLDGKRPATFESSKRIKFVEVSWGDEAASYTKGHVPSSFHVNTDHFEPPPKWYLGSPQVLEQFAADYGFQIDDTVIISGEDVTASYRLGVVLEYIGIADVRVLNGGLAAWKRAGFPVETKRRVPPKAPPFSAQVPGNPGLILSTETVKEKRKRQGKFVLVDTRTWDEFIGKESGYSYHEHKGRVPGAIYGQANYQGPDSMIPYRNIDGTMRNTDEIEALWRQAGIDTSGELCFYCGGGWRAAETLTIARIMGYEQSTLYSDGWIGWSNDRQNPVATGEPK